MKNIKLQRITWLAITCLLALSKIGFSQSFLYNQNNGTDWIGYTSTTLTGVGIGTFSGNISSALHINTNLTTAQSGTGPFGLGEAFRTQTPSNVDHTWKLLAGSTEIFRIENPASSGSIRLRGMSTGSMRLYTQDVQRIHVEPGASSNALSGFVGIGNVFSSPQSRLHLHQGGSEDIQLQLTTTATTNDDYAQGFTLGIDDGTKNAEVNQREAADMLFYTNNAEKMRILSAGNVGIGIAAPLNLIHQNVTGNVETYHQFTSGRSGTTSGDGFIIGITDRNGVAEVDLRQREPAAIRLWTDNTERLTLSSAGMVGIGNNAPIYNWLHVKSSGTASDYTVFAENNNAATTTGEMGGFKSTCNISRSTGSGIVNNGVFGQASGSIDQNTGIRGDAYGGSGSNNRGGYFTSYAPTGAAIVVGVETAATGGATLTAGVGSSSSGTGTNSYGVNAVANGAATNNYGVKGTATGGTNNYGVYGVATQNTGTCTATACTDAAGYFAGDLVYTGSSFQTSDLALKQNIVPITNALTLIGQILPKTYDFQIQNYPHMNLSDGIRYGVIAEDIELVIPGAVKEFVHPAKYDSLGNLIGNEILYKGVDYITFIPILLAGIKEQQVRIDSLVTVIGNGAKAGNPTSGNTNESSQQKVSLSNSSDGILYQNQPNPFRGSTKINYYIPENTGRASMIFYNPMGTTLKEVDIAQKGQGTVEVDAENLSSDIYTYSLVIDGKVIDTKRMMKTK